MTKTELVLTKDNQKYTIDVGEKEYYQSAGGKEITLTDLEISHIATTLFGGRLNNRRIVIGASALNNFQAIYYYNVDEGEIRLQQTLFTQGIPTEPLPKLRAIIKEMEQFAMIPAFYVSEFEFEAFDFDKKVMTHTLNKPGVTNKEVNREFLTYKTMMLVPEASNNISIPINLDELYEQPKAEKTEPVESEEVLNEFFEALNELKDANYSERRLSDNSFSIIKRSLNVVKRAYEKAVKNREERK